MNVTQVSHAKLQNMIANSYERKTPLFVHGTFGIGKSYAIKEYGKRKAKELGLTYSEDPEEIGKEGMFLILVIPLHQYDVSEIKGIPVPSEDRKSTIFLPTGQLPRMGQGIIFFDELNLAPPMIQANAYQLILDRRLGSYKLPDGYVAMAAGNTADDRAHNFEMATPLKNRFRHCQLTVPQVDAWAKEYAIPNGIDTRIITFLTFRNDYLYKFNPESNEDVMAIPTPRSWTMTSESIKDIEYVPILDADGGEADESTLEQNVSSCVGVGVASEFISFMKLSVKYDIAGIFKKGTIGKVPKEISETYALISAILSYYSKELKAKEPVVNKLAETLLDLSQEFSKEHMILLLSLAKGVDEKYFSRLKTQCFEKFKKVADGNTKFLMPS